MFLLNNNPPGLHTAEGSGGVSAVISVARAASSITVSTARPDWLLNTDACLL